METEKIKLKYKEPDIKLEQSPPLEGFYPLGGIMRNDDIAIGSRTVTLNAGDNIQGAIDAIKEDGGIIVLKNGTHTMNSNLTLYSNIYLKGENAGATILDFQNNAYGIVVAGSNVYTTGTVTVSNNSTTVTGSGTSWDSSMVGRSIMLDGLWYTIAAVSSATSLTIAAPYAGEDLSGANYTIATIVTDVKITDLTIKNASVGVAASYTNEFFIKDVEVQSSVTAYSITSTSQSSMNKLDAVANQNGYSFSDSHYIEFYTSGSVDTTVGNGLTLDNVSYSAFNDIFMVNSAGDGANLTDVKNTKFSGAFIENGGSGIEFVSGNSDVNFIGCAFAKNASDGVTFTATSDDIHLASNSIKNNGGYGVNIAASTCDNNIILGNTFSGNTSGAVSDSGTGTLIRSNIGMSDN